MAFCEHMGIPDLVNGGTTYRTTVIDWKLAFENNEDAIKSICLRQDIGDCTTPELICTKECPVYKESEEWLSEKDN